MLTKFKRWFKRPNNPAGNVYYARLKTTQGTFYKLGYTSKSTLVERMSYGDSGDAKLIEKELFFTYRPDAWDVEQTLLDYFDTHRAFGRYSNDPLKPLCGNGQSELFAHDILNLDEAVIKLTADQKQAIKADLEQANDSCLMMLIGLVLVPFTFGLSLFLIFGGASGVLLFGKGRAGRAHRSQHPPAITDLIYALSVQKAQQVGGA